MSFKKDLELELFLVAYPEFWLEKNALKNFQFKDPRNNIWNSILKKEGDGNPLNDPPGHATDCFKIQLNLTLKH